MKKLLFLFAFMLLLLFPLEQLQADWLAQPQSSGGFLKSPACACPLTGDCNCGPNCDCEVQRRLSDQGNVVQFKRDSAGNWRPVGEGWVLQGQHWVRYPATPTASPEPTAQPAPTYYYQSMRFSTSMSGFGGGRFGGGGCAGGG